MARRKPAPEQGSLFGEEESQTPQAPIKSPYAWPAAGQTTLVYLRGLESHPPMQARVLQYSAAEGYTVEFLDGPLKGRVAYGAQVRGHQVDNTTPPDPSAPF